MLRGQTEELATFPFGNSVFNVLERTRFSRMQRVLFVEVDRHNAYACSVRGA